MVAYDPARSKISTIMPARELEAVERAVQRYLTLGESIAAAAKAEGINRSTLQRGLQRRNIDTRGRPEGPAHHAYIDGRTAAKRQRVTP